MLMILTKNSKKYQTATLLRGQRLVENYEKNLLKLRHQRLIKNYVRNLKSQRCRKLAKYFDQVSNFASTSQIGRQLPMYFDKTMTSLRR